MWKEEYYGSRKNRKVYSRKKKLKKLTQQDLGELLGVSDRTIGNWENGRNMPDLSLFKPLCDELDITINELLSGQKLNQHEYQEKFEENIVNTIDYTSKELYRKNKLISEILLFFGLGIIFTAITIFPSESSWGSIYSVIGMMISLIGFSIMNKGKIFKKRLFLNLGYAILIMTILLTLDYANVKLNNNAPRFSYLTTTIDSTIYYDTLFYDVIRCNKNTKDETFHIIKNQKYNDEYIMNYCINK